MLDDSSQAGNCAAVQHADMGIAGKAGGIWCGSVAGQDVQAPYARGSEEHNEHSYTQMHLFRDIYIYIYTHPNRVF